MTEQTELSSVSMSNTKKELLDAYETAKKRFENLNEELLDAQKARKRLENKVVETTADAQVAQDPVKRLQELRGAISRELTDLAEKFESEIETYRKVQTAIKVKKEELKTIYDIETAASDLASLIDAHRMKKEQFEQNASEQKTEFESEMEQMKARQKKEKAEHDQKIKEETEQIKKERERQAEEYEYTFSRKKAQRKNELEDQLQTLEKEISTKQSNFENELQQQKTILDARENAITASEAELTALHKEVETFPKRLETETQTAVNETKERLNLAFENEKALMTARFDGEKNVLLGKIESLEKMMAAQEAQVIDLSKKSELAYEKVQDIANKAVTATHREHYTPTVISSSAPMAGDDNQT